MSESGHLLRQIRRSRAARYSQLGFVSHYNIPCGLYVYKNWESGRTPLVPEDVQALVSCQAINEEEAHRLREAVERDHHKRLIDDAGFEVDDEGTVTELSEMDEGFTKLRIEVKENDEDPSSLKVKVQVMTAELEVSISQLEAALQTISQVFTQAFSAPSIPRGQPSKLHLSYIHALADSRKAILATRETSYQVLSFLDELQNQLDSKDDLSTMEPEQGTREE